MSIFFYGYLNSKQLSILVISIMLNFAISQFILVTRNSTPLRSKFGLVFGIIANCGILGYFKYSDFFISNLNRLTGWDISSVDAVLPIGISFYTFSQIAYLIDCYKEKSKTHSFLDYVLFITYFPKLLAGPIVRFNEIVPQLREAKNKAFDYINFLDGVYLIFIGLFKKMVLADTFGLWVNNAFDYAPTLTFFEAWAASLAYTFQLYFDFSGYTDIAIGIALAMNIKLPDNFDSPYKAKNIREFWHRWHITLGRFIWEFVYVPLGGSKISEIRTVFNLLLAFLVCGLWHGVGWTFIFWGFLHGAALAVQHCWGKLNIICLYYYHGS